jgi:O-antigen ligase
MKLGNTKVHIGTLSNRGIAQAILTIGMGLFIAKAILMLPSIHYLVLFGLMVISLFFLRYPEVGLIIYSTSLGFLDPICERLDIPVGMRALPFASMLAFLFLIFILKGKKSIQLCKMHLIAISILALLLIGLLWTPSPKYGLHKVEAYILYNLMIFYCVTLFEGDRRRLERIIKTGALLGILFFFVDLAYFLAVGDVGEWERFSFLGFSSIGLGRSLGVLVISLLLVAKISSSIYRRNLLLAFIVPLIFFIYNTGSRGPTFALLITVFVYFIIFEKRPLWQKLGFGVITVIVAYGLFSFAPQEAQARYLNLLRNDDPELNVLYTGSRRYLYELGIRAFKTHPFLGLGTGGYSDFYGAGDHKLYPHNLFLEMACELGIVGLTIIILFVFFNLRLAFTIIKNHPRITQNNFYLFWGILIFTFGLINSMVTGDIADNMLIWVGSAFMWTAYKTKELETSENLRRDI